MKNVIYAIQENVRSSHKYVTKMNKDHFSCLRPNS